MKHSQLIFSSFLILFAFFLGYVFKTLQYEKNNQVLENTREYVNIIIKKKTLEFITSDRVDILINGEKSNSGSITLE